MSDRFDVASRDDRNALLSRFSWFMNDVQNLQEKLDLIRFRVDDTDFAGPENVFFALANKANQNLKDMKAVLKSWKDVLEAVNNSELNADLERNYDNDDNGAAVSEALTRVAFHRRSSAVP